MRILIAEDEIDTAIQYKLALEERGHTVIIAMNGEECIRLYKEGLKIYSQNHKNSNLNYNNINLTPFDTVILDYRIPERNGMDVAKEILKLNTRQRIIFASAYVKESLLDSVKQLKHLVELIQKPFDLDILIDMVEDERSYMRLQELNEYLKELDEFELTQEQIQELLKSLELY